MQKIERQSMTQLAVDHLRESITLGDIKMGTPLQEASLSKQLGISRTPIREALFKLQAEGLVVNRPYRGTSVFTVTQEELEDLVDFREVIEVAAARKAMNGRMDGVIEAIEEVIAEMKDAVAANDIRRYLLLDHQLHNALVESSGSRCLIDGYSLIASKMKALRTALGQTQERIFASFEAHEELLYLMKAGNCEGLCALLHRHIQDGKELFSTGPGVVFDNAPQSQERLIP
jgi:DNA-binding GntR family transcriptional regulator